MHLPLTHERISFGQAGVPEIPLLFSACRSGPESYLCDLVDFSEKAIDRWKVPFRTIPRAIELLRQHIPRGRLPLGAASHEEHFRQHYTIPHTAQVCSNGRLFVGLGDPYNGFCIHVIDTADHVLHVVPEDFAENLMLHASTGGFFPDREGWLFVRWPFEDALEIMDGRRELVRCEVGKLGVDGLEIESLYGLETVDRAHQVALSPDGRHVVFAPFKWDLNVPYPPAAIQDDPEGYRRSHDAGIKTHRLVTVDLASERHWETDVPVPVIGHPHFDPVDPAVFYLSAHNICPTGRGMMIEGPAAIYRMRLGEGETVIEGSYSDEGFLRISQHTLFRLGDRTMIAVTNLPNHLDLIDGTSMVLWRRVELFPAPPLDLRATGNALCPPYPDSCLSVSVSEDGGHVVLESSREFRIYDVEGDRLLDAVVPLRLPEGSRVVGHARRPGE